MIPLDIRLFGTIEIQRSGETLTDFRSQKALVLLAYLICQARPLTRDFLAGLAWPDHDQSHALGLLRRSLHDLNQQLPGCLAIDRRTVCFCPDVPVTIDLHTFAHCAQQCDPAAWTQAAALYRAPFLHGVYVNDAPELEAWLLREQEHWQRALVQVLHRLIGHHTRRAEYDQALQYIQRLLLLEPWREEAHRQAMLLLARTGQLSAALAQYERCRQTLQAELGVEPAQETERLYTRLKAVAHAPSSRLPVSLTPFLGREHELAELVQLLADPTYRLITLVGPGGMGKTRLAIETARMVICAQLRLFLHGAVFVSLVNINTATQLLATLAQALALPPQSHQLSEVQLLQYLRDKELLLILDNFEQLVEPESLSLLSKLLHAAPDVKLLVTSRVRLQLQGEQLYWMQGLSLPATEQLLVDEIAGHSSVQLYLATSSRIRADYTLTARDVPAVTAICQRVQGIPLAIELAAAWMISLTPTEIAAELSRNLDFLASELHDLPPRQRSMRAVFATSWRLLTEEEKMVFRQLALFRGSFTQAAAQVVTGASLATLTSLIHKSFLQRAPGERYQIHELLRQFGEEKLAEMPSIHCLTAGHHSEYYLNFVAQRAAGLNGKQQANLLNEFGEEIDNICQGWLWAARHGKYEWLDQALNGIFDYYQVRSRFVEGVELLLQTVQALSCAETESAMRLLRRVQARQGALYWEIGQYEEAYVLLTVSLAWARQMDIKTEIIFCLNYLGRTVWLQQGAEAAVPLVEESLALSRELRDSVSITMNLMTLAIIWETSSQYRRARQVAEECLAISRQLGQPYSIAHNLKRLGAITYSSGEYAQAVDFFEEAIALFRKMDDRLGLVSTLVQQGNSMYATGAYSGTTLMPVLEEAAHLARGVGTYEALFLGLSALSIYTTWLGNPQIGEDYAKELIALSQPERPDHLASSLWLLSEAELSQGKLGLARQHLQEALMMIGKSRTRQSINAERALLAWAQLLLKECGLLETSNSTFRIQQNQAYAFEILTSIIHDPEGRVFSKTRAAKLAAMLEALLSADLVSVVKDCGQSKTMRHLVAEIMVA